MSTHFQFYWTFLIRKSTTYWYNFVVFEVNSKILIQKRLIYSAIKNTLFNRNKSRVSNDDNDLLLCDLKNNEQIPLIFPVNIKGICTLFLSQTKIISLKPIIKI